jgi:hypothetical protein
LIGEIAAARHANNYQNLCFCFFAAIQTLEPLSKQDFLDFKCPEFFAAKELETEKKEMEAFFSEFKPLEKFVFEDEQSALDFMCRFQNIGVRKQRLDKFFQGLVVSDENKTSLQNRVRIFLLSRFFAKLTEICNAKNLNPNYSENIRSENKNVVTLYNLTIKPFASLF